VTASLQTIAADTGLSKSAVQRGLRTLARRRLVRVEKPSRTGVPSYAVLRPWIRR
jgi:DNA-binding IclR family transcriptional regulator